MGLLRWKWSVRGTTKYPNKSTPIGRGDRGATDGDSDCGEQSPVGEWDAVGLRLPAAGSPPRTSRLFYTKGPGRLGRASIALNLPGALECEPICKKRNTVERNVAPEGRLTTAQHFQLGQVDRTSASPGETSGTMRAGATRKKIALLIESSRVYGRGVLRGIAIYARTHANWSIYQQERGLGDPPPKWLRNWRGDGIIARADTKQLASEVRRLQLPTVDLSGLFPLPGVPVIETDDRGVVQLACDHLLERGFRSFAFCGFAGAGYSERRKALAIDYSGALGCDSFGVRDPAPRVWQARRGLNRAACCTTRQLGDWLVGLEKPTALLACNDIRAQQVLNVCRERGIQVPDEVAVMGVDNDEVFCELADPPLSSVDERHRADRS